MTVEQNHGKFGGTAQLEPPKNLLLQLPVLKMQLTDLQDIRPYCEDTDAIVGPAEILIPPSVFWNPQDLLFTFEVTEHFELSPQSLRGGNEGGAPFSDFNSVSADWWSRETTTASGSESDTDDDSFESDSKHSGCANHGDGSLKGNNCEFEERSSKVRSKLEEVQQLLSAMLSTTSSRELALHQNNLLRFSAKQKKSSEFETCATFASPSGEASILMLYPKLRPMNGQMPWFPANSSVDRPDLRVHASNISGTKKRSICSERSIIGCKPLLHSKTDPFVHRLQGRRMFAALGPTG